MRNGWRKLLYRLVFGTGLGLIFAGMVSPCEAAWEGSRPVRLTIEIGWTTPGDTAGSPNDAPEISLDISEGRIVEVVPSPPGSTRSRTTGPERKSTTSWKLGAERSGRVRARIETAPGANLRFTAGGQPMSFPLPVVLEGLQRTPPQSPVEITVERVSWDVISVDLTPAPKASADNVLGSTDSPIDGVVVPGSKIPITVAFNVLSPEPTEVTLRCIAELKPLRGGDAVWSGGLADIVIPTNAATPPSFVFPVVVPKIEGTYVLEIHATWEPTPAHDGGKLIGRLIRRGRQRIFGRLPAA